MKLYLRSYKIPTVLIIMGSLMCIAASLQFAENFIELLFGLGTVCVCLGILGWLSVQFGNFLSRRRIRAKVDAKVKAPAKSTKAAGRMRQYPF